MARLPANQAVSFPSRALMPESIESLRKQCTIAQESATAAMADDQPAYAELLRTRQVFQQELQQADSLLLEEAADMGARRIFVGVIDPIDPRVETPEDVRDRVLEATRFIDPSHLGTTDDCGFSPFGDDVSTSRDTAFAKIGARIDGTAMASDELGI